MSNVIPWDIASRPTTIKDFSFQDERQKEKVVQWVEEGSIPHLLFSGHHGTGKTSLAYLLKIVLEIDDSDFLALNASDDNNVEAIRTKVKSFISNYASSNFKLVLLDEADFLSPAAQGVLRGMMVDFAENARFILTCNMPHKIMPALKSRCQEIVFKKLNKVDLQMKLVKILRKFGKYDVVEDDLDIIEAYVEQSYPDFRKIIGNVQANFINGELRPPSEINEADEWKVVLTGMMEDGEWDQIRTYMAKNTSDDQWEEVYNTLYTYLGEFAPFKTNKMKWDCGIIVIADYLYKHSIVADPEINFAACIIKLSHLAKE